MAILKLKNNKFCPHKTPIILGNVDAEKAVVSNKIFFPVSTLLVYWYNGSKVKPLNIMLPKTSTYVKRSDGQTKWMYYLIEDDELLAKYNTIWDRVSADIKKQFYNEPVYYKNYLKTKIKSYGDEVTDFFHTCLAVTSLDSALKKDDKRSASAF